MKIRHLSLFCNKSNRYQNAQQNFMKAMASLGKWPYKSSDVATRLNKQPKSIGLVRTRLISKRFVYFPKHGEVEPTTPPYDEYIGRNFDLSSF